MADHPSQPRIDLGGGSDRPNAYDPDAQPELFEGTLGRRVVAFIVDLTIVLALTFVAYIVLIVGGLLTFGLTWLLLGVAFPAIALLYSAITFGSPASATLGMRMMGLEMRTWYGSPVYALLGAFHTLVYYFSISILTPLVLLVPLFNARKRCLHDYLCGTVVINTPETAQTMR
jgi:uncharacterized RDD family membrane protein YckC